MAKFALPRSGGPTPGGAIIRPAGIIQFICTEHDEALLYLYIRQTTERTRSSPCDAPYFSS